VAASGVPRPKRMLAAVGIILAALYLGMFLGPSATPKLGLDLRGGTQVILTATPLHGKTITHGALDQAVSIIRQRVDAAGVGGAAINTQGNNDIIVSAPGASRDQLAALDQTALLNFRQVIAAGAFAPTPAPSASSSASASPSATSGTPSPSSSKSGNGDRVPDVLTLGSPSPSPSPSASGTPSTAPVSPVPSATNSTGNVDLQPLPGSQGKDVASVTAAFQALDCTRTPNPTEGLDEPGNFIIACDKDQGLKYILGPADVQGSQISSASATIDPQSNEWQVLLDFSHHGGDLWLKLTQKAAKQPAIQTGCQPPAGCNAVAIVLDGVVESAPTITDPNGIAGGRAQITGNFTQKRANTLANVLKFGALPLKLEKADVSSVSATLGSDQLRGGLIAGAIGLVLVVVYSLLYYRALGLVTIASLALSGLLLYAVTTLLGHSALGYTLSLAGIAGFIVAVGITADSFVVFFERIRDEVREGKRLRSAVERAWPRARRTIISADAVSLLAAVVLYAVSIGDVRGFAFTLGMSTLSDLFIVFFFTKPLLTVVAQRKAFDSNARWTGIGQPRADAPLEQGEA
jgi:preprotein translocase subunit SecD